MTIERQIWTPTLPELIEQLTFAMNHPGNNKSDDWTQGYRQGLEDALDNAKGLTKWVG